MGPRLKTAETLATSGTDKMTARQKTAETLDMSGSVKFIIRTEAIEK